MNIQHLPLTNSLARRIEQNDVDYSLSRLEGMSKAEGNPLGIQIKRFGNAIAFLTKGWPDFWYGNRVLGVEPSNEGDLEEITAFFGRSNLPFRYEITPWSTNGKLASHLHRLGFCQMGFNTAIYGSPQAGQIAAGESFVVNEVLPDEIDLFLDLYQDGFGLPRLRNNEREAVHSWLEIDRPRLYLCIARLGEKPAGVGILFLNQGIGLLADAATLPEFQGKGCHAAMIRHRIDQAIERGCDLLTSFVEFNSSSHNNLERTGLRIAYTKSMWWESPGVSPVP